MNERMPDPTVPFDPISLPGAPPAGLPAVRQPLSFGDPPRVIPPPEPAKPTAPKPVAKAPAKAPDPSAAKPEIADQGNPTPPAPPPRWVREAIGKLVYPTWKKGVLGVAVVGSAAGAWWTLTPEKWFSRTPAGATAARDAEPPARKGGIPPSDERTDADPTPPPVKPNALLAQVPAVEPLAVSIPTPPAAGSISSPTIDVPVVPSVSPSVPVPKPEMPSLGIDIPKPNVPPVTVPKPDIVQVQATDPIPIPPLTPPGGSAPATVPVAPVIPLATAPDAAKSSEPAPFSLPTPGGAQVAPLNLSPIPASPAPAVSTPAQFAAPVVASPAATPTQQPPVSIASTPTVESPAIPGVSLIPPAEAANKSPTPSPVLPVAANPPDVTPAPPALPTDPRSDLPPALPTGTTAGAPARPAALTRTPQSGEVRTDFDVDLHDPRPGDTYEAISRQHYGDAKYADALRAYNGGRALGAGGAVQVPPMYVLRQRYRDRIGAPRPASYNPTSQTDPARDRGVSQGVEWAPAAGSRTDTREQQAGYTVPRGGMNLEEVATDVYGDRREWRRLWDANPQVDPKTRMPEGTRLQLPAEGRR